MTDQQSKSKKKQKKEKKIKKDETVEDNIRSGGADGKRKRKIDDNTVDKEVKSEKQKRKKDKLKDSLGQGDSSDISSDKKKTKRVKSYVEGDRTSQTKDKKTKIKKVKVTSEEKLNGHANKKKNLKNEKGKGKVKHVGGTKKTSSKAPNPEEKDARLKEKKRLKNLERKQRDKDEKLEAEGTDEITAVMKALEYLKSWKHEKHTWKFQKVRQIWLLQHIYNTDQVDEDNFTIVLEYLEGMKGKAREQTVKEAQDIISKGDDDTEMSTDDEKMDRARQILQILG